MTKYFLNYALYKTGIVVYVLQEYFLFDLRFRVRKTYIDSKRFLYLTIFIKNATFIPLVIALLAIMDQRAHVLH